MHGSHRQVIELLRDLFGVSLSIGTIHAWVEQAASRARRAEAQARLVAAGVKTLTGWLGQDVLSLAGLPLEERRALFDFIVAQLRLHEHLAAAPVPLPATSSG